MSSSGKVFGVNQVLSRCVPIPSLLASFLCPGTSPLNLPCFPWGLGWRGAGGGQHSLALPWQSPLWGRIHGVVCRLCGRAGCRHRLSEGLRKG